MREVGGEQRKREREVGEAKREGTREGSREREREGVQGRAGRNIQY